LFGEHRVHFLAVLEAVLRSADAGEALVRHWPTDEAVAAALRGSVLVAAGKASVTMARAAIDRLGVKPSMGVVLSQAGSRSTPALHAAGIRCFEVDHPLPTQRNLIAARAVGDAARLASSRKVPLLVLLSGGASAHLTGPERGLTLSDVRSITDLLLKAGAPIADLNAVRACCEQLKAGGLARLAAPSPVFAFILADVLGDPPPVAVIGSGPTADVAPSPENALRVLERRSLLEAVPTITAHLRSQIKARPARPGIANISNTIIGSNASALIAARAAVEQLGFTVVEARTSVEGDARIRGRELAQLLLASRTPSETPRPIALLWGGETTVNVRSARTNSGHGGRNQEAALAAAMAIAGHPNVAVLCFATDGIDGVAPPGRPSPAGAIVTGETLAAAKASGGPGSDPEKALETHDSYAFVQAAHSALQTGPTGTNVNDIWVALAYP
jgi:glycerate-2-kinase